jgi:hypothetical protein
MSVPVGKAEFTVPTVMDISPGEENIYAQRD